MINATKPSGSSYEIPYFSPEELRATLDYLAGVLPADAAPVHRQRLAHLGRVVDEQSLVLRAPQGADDALDT